MEEEEEVVVPLPGAAAAAEDAYSRLDEQIDLKTNEVRRFMQELKQNHADFRKLLQVLQNKINLRMPEDKARFDETKLSVLTLIERMDSLVSSSALVRHAQIGEQTDALVRRNAERATQALASLDAALALAALESKRQSSPHQRLLRWIVSTQLVLLLLVLLLIVLLL